MNGLVRRMVGGVENTKKHELNMKNITPGEACFDSIEPSLGRASRAIENSSILSQQGMEGGTVR